MQEELQLDPRGLFPAVPVVDAHGPETGEDPERVHSDDGQVDYDEAIFLMLLISDSTAVTRTVKDSS